MSTSKYCPCFAPTGDTNIHFNNCLKDISDPIFVISTILLSNGGNRYLAVASSCPRIIHNPVKIEPRPCNKQVSKEDTMNKLEYQHWHPLSSRQRRVKKTLLSQWINFNHQWRRSQVIRYIKGRDVTPSLISQSEESRRWDLTNQRPALLLSHHQDPSGQHLTLRGDCYCRQSPNPEQKLIFVMIKWSLMSTLSDDYTFCP